MRRIFLDTFYLQALADPRDDSHHRAMNVSAQLGTFTGVTSEMVLTELLNALSGATNLRQVAVNITTDLRRDPTIEIVPQSSELFEEAFQFYGQRLDKGYGLTDCASMLIMRRLEIWEVLTFDRHFKQEGFKALLRDD